MVAIILGKNLKPIILDHRIGKQVVGNLVELLLIGTIDFDLD